MYRYIRSSIDNKPSFGRFFYHATHSKEQAKAIVQDGFNTDTVYLTDSLAYAHGYGEYVVRCQSVGIRKLNLVPVVNNSVDANDYDSDVQGVYEPLHSYRGKYSIVVFDVDALNKPLPSYFDVVKLICNDDVTQSNKRIFRFRNMEEGFTEQCTILKIYIDSIIPQNEYLSQVNYGIDVICHNKIIDINVDKNDESLIIDEVDGIPIRVETKSRITALTRCILALLNGADIAGVGQLQFNAGRFRYNQVMSGVWNNRNFEGTKIVLGALQSGLS